MAHGPSPFGVPQREPRYEHSVEDLDRVEHIDGAHRTAPAARRSPEEELQEHLEHIQASPPLRRAAQRARRRTRWWLVALAVVSGLAVVAACGAGAFIVLSEDEAASAPQGEPTADDTRSQSLEDDISGAPGVVDPIEERATDPEPVSAVELFDSGSFTPAGASGAYEVLTTDELADCSEAGLDELAELLADSGCTQTVRATLASPDGEYAATAGVLNLEDAAGAERLRDAVEAGVDGGFAVLRSDGAGAELGRAATMVGYNAYGHYLMYVVIGRTDGEDLEDADEAVLTVVNDIVDVWLVDRLLPRREVR